MVYPSSSDEANAGLDRLDLGEFMGLFDHLKKKESSEKKRTNVSERTSSAEPMVSSILNEKRILFFTAGPSKQQVFGSLIAALDLPDPSAALKAILSREEAGSTIITDG